MLTAVRHRMRTACKKEKRREEKRIRKALKRDNTIEDWESAQTGSDVGLWAQIPPYVTG